MVSRDLDLVGDAFERGPVVVPGPDAGVPRRRRERAEALRGLGVGGGGGGGEWWDQRRWRRRIEIGWVEVGSVDPIGIQPQGVEDRARDPPDLAEAREAREM